MINNNFNLYGADDFKPFEIKKTLLKKGALRCEKRLRFLPDRRLVCQAKYGDEDVVVKVFYGSGYKKRWQKEKAGVLAINRQGIKTPKLIESMVDKNKHFALIIFEFIAEAHSLAQLIDQAQNNTENDETHTKVIQIIAKMHDRDIFQRDIHLDNFLQNPDGLWLIDGEEIVENNTQSDQWAINNLAMFFSQFKVWQTVEIKQLYDDYLHYRSTDCSQITWPLVENKMKKLRLWRERKYINKKVFRSCSEFGLIRKNGDFCVYAREFGQDNANYILDNLAKLLAKGEVLKSGTSATVTKIEIGSKLYIVKQYKSKGFFYQLARSVVKSKAAESWRYGHLLRFYDLPTAAPVLMCERRIGVFRRSDSYVVTEHLTGINSYDFFHQKGSVDGAEKMLDKLKKLIQRMHQCGFSHGDLKAQNIYISGDKPYLIDLDGMQKHKEVNEQIIAKDWQRLQRDLEINPTVQKSLF